MRMAKPQPHRRVLRENAAASCLAHAQGQAS
jgi:hypothetical protein